MIKPSGKTLAHIKRILKSMASGRANDSVKLIPLLESGDLEAIDRLDLGLVTEVKMGKGGGAEVKLADRLGAIKLLLELEEKASEVSSADAFFSALAASPPQLDPSKEVLDDHADCEDTSSA